MDKLKKLLDDGYHIGVFQNQLDSYTANAFMSGVWCDETDDFTPLKAIERLHDKVYSLGEYA